jgi:hypothetical protein
MLNKNVIPAIVRFFFAGTYPVKDLPTQSILAMVEMTTFIFTYLFCVPVYNIDNYLILLQLGQVIKQYIMLFRVGGKGLLQKA